MTAPNTPVDNSPAAAGTPILDDALVAADAQLHSPGQPPGGTGPTRPNIIRAFPSDQPDPYAETGDSTHEVQPGAPLEQPDHNAPKPEWVDFAVSQGVDRDEAQGTSKADLVKRFGA